MLTASTTTSNSQVPESTKNAIYYYFRGWGVSGIRRASILHSYPGGFVAVSLRRRDDLSRGELGSWNKAVHAAVDDYWRNKLIRDGCVWVHEEWINRM